MGDVEVRQLRYFVAVAEELHFGRAAARLGMAQPPLSRAIRELERRLGVPLLERTTRRVVLTPAGEVLLREGRSALDTVAAAVARARRAGEAVPALRVALKADFDAGLMPRILALYEDDAAALPVELLLGGRDEQVPALRDGRADVALLFSFVGDRADHRGLDVEPLLTEPRLVALAATDPLAARTSLRLADLTGRTLPDGLPAEQGGLAQAERPPTTGLDLAQIFNLTELGRIVWFAPVSLARRHARPTIAYRPVDDLPFAALAVAWPRDSRSSAVAAFVRAAVAVAAAAHPADELPVPVS